MRSAQLAFANARDPERVLDAINYVRSTENPDIRGLTQTLKEVLGAQTPYSQRLEHYDDPRMQTLQAQFLLARIILNESVHCYSRIEKNFVHSQLENHAYGFYRGRWDQDSLRNWTEAQRTYLCQGLTRLIYISEGSI